MLKSNKMTAEAALASLRDKYEAEKRANQVGDIERESVEKEV